MARVARSLHPGAWWLWALGLAAAATATTNPLVLLTIVATAGFVVTMRRSDHAWSGAFRLYLVLGVVIVLIRVVFRIVLTLDVPGQVLFTLPEIPLPHWVLGMRLFGPVTRESLLGGLYDGLRLATLVIAVGAANSLANPKRLLKSMPPALYEIGTSLVVSVSVLPQLADSLRRVRAARRLRAVRGGRIGRLRGLVVPVLEDALERSLALAAGMDARGYGRAGNLTAGRRATTGGLMLLGLCGICVGVYAFLDQTAPQWLGIPMLLGGVLVALLGFLSAGRRVRRSRYRPDRWLPAELGVAACGVVVAVGCHLLSRDPAGSSMMYPDPAATPTMSGLTLAVLLVGVLPAVLAPPPRLSTRPSRPDTESPTEARTSAGKEGHDDRAA